MEKSFQSIASIGLERSIPMFLIGTEDSQKGFTLYYPLDPYLDGKHITSSHLASVLDEIHGTSNAVPWETADFESFPREKLVDAFEDGEDSVTIETSVTHDEEPKITTLVYRRGEVIVREEQVVRSDEPELTDKIEAQHIAALSSYAPAPRQPGRNHGSEVSGPIVLPRTEQETTSESETGIGGRKRFSKPLLIIGMVVFCGIVFYLSTRQVTPLPKPISRPEMMQGEPRILLREDKIHVDDSNPFSHAQMADKTKDTGARGRQKDSFPDEKILDTAQEIDASAEESGFENSDAVLFPGRFRPNKTTFGFRNRGEEQVFISSIRELSNEKKIRLRVRFKDRHVSDQKRRLGTARAHAVFRYLKEQGMRKKDMSVGKSMDNQADQQPGPKMVDLVIDQ
jgi:hypothetical protein